MHERFYAEGHRRELRLVVGSTGDVLGYFLVKARRYSDVTRWRVEDLHLGSLIDWRVFEPSALSFEDLVPLATEVLGDLGRRRHRGVPARG